MDGYVMHNTLLHAFACKKDLEFVGKIEKHE